MTRFAGRSTTSQRLGLLGVLVLLLGLVLPFAPAAEATHPLGTPDDVTTDRFAGSDRFDTAGIIADDAFGTSGDVLLARGDLFPDALSGNYLAGIRGVPIVLLPHDHLDEDTMEALEDLGAENITILGETAAISAANEQRLEDEGYNVDRVGGIDRYETSKLTGETGEAEGVVGTWNGERTAIVPSGENFPDALVAGALGYSENFPVLLTHPSFLPEFTAEALENLDIERVIIPGGPVAVSQDAEDDINALGIETTRVFGENRVVTATEFANFVQDEFGWTYETINIARGDQFPDALTIGPHAGEAEAPILLTHNPNALGSTVHDDGGLETEPWLQEHACEIRALHFAGGVHAITDATADQAVTAANDCGEFVATLNAEHVGDATNQVGDDHTVQVTATENDGDDAAAIDVRFEVTRDGSATGTPSSDNEETDANGQANFTYTNDTAGDDTITVCANHDGSVPASCDEADLTDSVTKTWTSEPPRVATTLDASPNTDENVVGDNHTVNATVEDQNGDPLEGVRVVFEVSGQNAATLSDTTDANGFAEATYTGDGGEGQDSILVYADRDEDFERDTGEPSETVTKDWVIGPPSTLDLTPESDVNPVESTHTVNAVVRDRNDNVVDDVVVLFEVTGTSGAAGETGTDTTDVSGVATFAYTSDTPGEDTITACTQANGDEPDTCLTATGPDDTATKTWEERIPTTLDLAPENEVNEVTFTDDHQMTATVRDQFGDAVEGVWVQFEVTGTSNGAGNTQLVQTDEDGQATFGYASNLPGEDEIAACADQSGTPPGDCTFEDPDDPIEEGEVDLEDVVVKTWESTPEQLTLDSQEATNTVGDQHTVTATVTDGTTQPVEGTVVRFEVDDQLEATATTDSTGQATLQYSATTAGDDTIEACTNEDGTTPDDCPTTAALTDSQIKHWTAGAPATLDLAPEEATNTVGTDHTVVATVTDEHGNPVEGDDVHFEVFSASTTASPTSGNLETGPDGTVTFTYSNETPGDDVIRACTDGDSTDNNTFPGCDNDEAVAENDNTDLTDAVSKTWEADVANAQLDLDPEETTNTVGTQHTVTATVTDQFDNPLAGYDVRFYVEEDETTTTVATTDASGQATFTYDGPDSPTDETIAACSNEDTTAPDEGDCPTEPAEPDDTANLVDRVIKHWVS